MCGRVNYLPHDTQKARGERQQGAEIPISSSTLLKTWLVPSRPRLLKVLPAPNSTTVFVVTKVTVVTDLVTKSLGSEAFGEIT